MLNYEDRTERNRRERERGFKGRSERADVDKQRRNSAGHRRPKRFANGHDCVAACKHIGLDVAAHFARAGLDVIEGTTGRLRRVRHAGLKRRGFRLKVNAENPYWSCHNISSQKKRPRCSPTSGPILSAPAFRSRLLRG